MLAFAPGVTGDKLAAKQDAGTDIVVEVNGDIRTISGATDAYGCIFQGALSSVAAALVGPAAGTDALVASIKVSNTGTSTRVVTLYKTKNSVTYDATTQWHKVTLLDSECAEWISGLGWMVYNAQGIPKNAPTTSGAVLSNAALAAVTGYAADTYLAGSALALPTGLIRAKSCFYWVFDIVKTAAGTATPTVILRFGTGGVVGDAARVTLTFSAQTAAIDRGTIEVWANFNSVGAAGVLNAIAKLNHQLAITGLNSTTQNLQTLNVASAGFDTTVANSILGLSVNGGASAAWTISGVQVVGYL